MLVLLITLFSIGACIEATSENAAESAPDEPVAQKPIERKVSGCGDDGALQTELFGSIETQIQWSGSDMFCQSMRRPNGEGIRLRFAGEIGTQTLAIIIALPKLEPGVSVVESPSTVTATVEDSGRFFSTPNLDICWTDVDFEKTINSDSYVISATLYCVAPLGEINGDAAISIPQISFTTLANWT